jgi:hypothetical protein
VIWIELVGADRNALVEQLVSLYANAVKTNTPMWVSIEAGS